MSLSNKLPNSKKTVFESKSFCLIYDAKSKVKRWSLFTFSPKPHSSQNSLFHAAERLSVRFDKLFREARQRSLSLSPHEKSTLARSSVNKQLHALWHTEDNTRCRKNLRVQQQQRPPPRCV